MSDLLAMTNLINPGHQGTRLIHEDSGRRAVLCECGWQSQWATDLGFAEAGYLAHFDGGLEA